MYGPDAVEIGSGNGDAADNSGMSTRNPIKYDDEMGQDRDNVMCAEARNLR